MRRIHFFEIGDQPWCPETVRDAITDYLLHAQQVFQPYLAIVPLLQAALARAGTRQIVDLCSGAGGSWPHLLPALTAAGVPVSVRFTDKFVNRSALNHLCATQPEQLSCQSGPVDATAVPASLAGFRTLFSSFHHFRPAAASAILADAVRHGQGIGIFELTQRSPRSLGRSVAVLPLVLWWAPQLRPFRWPRLLLTWLVPIMAPIVMFESIVSSLRSYTPAELSQLARTADPDQRYSWETGEVAASGSAVPVTYLVGTPKY